MNQIIFKTNKQTCPCSRKPDSLHVSFIYLLLRGTDSSGYTVVLGKSKLDATDDKEQIFQVERIIHHHEYSDERGDFNSDIGKWCPKYIYNPEHI